jgi:hypothetical protein
MADISSVISQPFYSYPPSSLLSISISLLLFSPLIHSPLPSVSAFATARADGYTSHNKRSKSILAPASSLAHDIDSTSNKSVTLGGTGAGGGGQGSENLENRMHSVDVASGGHSDGSVVYKDTTDNHIHNISDNNTSENNESEIDKNKQKKKCDVTVPLSSNGRMVSANNKHSFSSANMTNTDVKVAKKAETEGETEATSYLVKRPRIEEMNAEREGKTSIRRGESKSDNDSEISAVNGVEKNTEAEAVKEVVKEAVQGDSKAKKDEVKGKYPSKSSKWLDFAAWVENIRTTDREKEAALLKTDCANTYARSRTYDVIVDGANVGYYKQNFNGAPTHIDYRQVDWMLRQLILRGRVQYNALHYLPAHLKCSVVALFDFHLYQFHSSPFFSF